VADPRTLRLELGDGPTVEWDLAALAKPDGDERPFELAELDPGRWELARVFSGALEDGRLVAIAGLRPRGAAGHGEEAIGAALVRDGEPIILDEALVSVEYDPDGAPRRVGLELYETPEALPFRIAADRADAGPGDGDTVLELRADGVRGSGRLSFVQPG
jgi:hypothetical protein